MKREGPQTAVSTPKRGAFPQVVDPSRGVQIPLDAVTDGLFEEVHCRHYLHAPPSVDLQSQESLSGFIQETLPEICFKYSSAFGGVPCGFDDVAVVPDVAAVFVSDSPWAHFWVQARWLVFVPKVGHRLSGMVTAQTAEHVSLLLLGYFTVSIAALQLSSQYQWAGGVWASPTAALHGGQSLEFEVIEVGESAADGLILIRGSVDKLQMPATQVHFSKKAPAEQYGDHLLVRKLALDGATARKRLRKQKLGVSSS